MAFPTVRVGTETVKVNPTLVDSAVGCFGKFQANIKKVPNYVVVIVAIAAAIFIAAGSVLSAGVVPLTIVGAGLAAKLGLGLIVGGAALGALAITAGVIKYKAVEKKGPEKTEEAKKTYEELKQECTVLGLVQEIQEIEKTPSDAQYEQLYRKFYVNKEKWTSELENLLKAAREQSQRYQQVETGLRMILGILKEQGFPINHRMLISRRIASFVLDNKHAIDAFFIEKTYRVLDWIRNLEPEVDTQGAITTISILETPLRQLQQMINTLPIRTFIDQNSLPDILQTLCLHLKWKKLTESQEEQLRQGLAMLNSNALTEEKCREAIALCKTNGDASGLDHYIKDLRNSPCPPAT